MASTERLLDHYETQATACEKASADLKRAWKLRDKNITLAREAARSLGLASHAWRGAARALMSTDQFAETEHRSRVEKAVKFHRISLDRLEELGLPVPAMEDRPREEPDVVPVHDVDPAVIEITHRLAINNPDSGQPDWILGAGSHQDRHFLVSESTGETDPVSIDAEEHPSLESAWEEILDQVSRSELSSVNYEPRFGTLHLAWGDQGAAVVPHGALWRAWVRTWRRAEVTEHATKEQAIRSACDAVDGIADAMEPSGRVAELGALWLRRAAAQARAELYEQAFYSRLQAAKDDRVVDRYGEINNDQLAQLARLSVARINKVLADRSR